MKLIVGIICVLFCGCTHIRVSSSYIDDAGKPRTDTLYSTSFFAKNNLDKVEVAYKTKTTSKLFGAKGVETSADSEGINAFNNLIKSIAEGAVIGAGKALKP